MKIAVSTLALPAGDPGSLLPALAALGVAGLEISADRLGDGDGSASALLWRRAAETAGLEVVGIAGLLDDRPELGIFADGETRERTLDRLSTLSALCRDMGGRTLVLGAGRRRGDLPAKAAWGAARTFLDQLLPRLEDHGTLLCFEPLGPADTDFCNTATECRFLADHLDHPSLGLMLSARGQAENDDTGHMAFAALRGRLDHFHANEPGLAPLGATGRIDHADFRRHLAANGYRGWLTLVQRAASDPWADPWADLEARLRFVRDMYLRKDNLSLARRDREWAAGRPAVPEPPR